MVTVLLRLWLSHTQIQFRFKFLVVPSLFYNPFNWALLLA